MAEITIKSVKVSQIRLNLDNPRTITGPGLEKLIKSIRDFPEMMELREIVVDENMVVLGGNMRLLALQKSGVKDCIAKIVKGLTDEQKREFIIKDNAVFGEWDFDLLANSWADLPLADFGLNLPDDWLKESSDDDGSQGDGENMDMKYQIIIECENEKHQTELLKRFEQEEIKCRPLML